MAHLQDRRVQNVDGNFYVDSSCIDCDTCRWIAPQVYGREGSQSRVHHQPVTEAERIVGFRGLAGLPDGFYRY